MITVIVVLGVVAASALVYTAFALSSGRSNRLPLDVARIEQRKNAAMDDIRRRRHYAEDQLRRLSRWQ